MQLFVERHKAILKASMQGVLEHEQKLQQLDDWWGKVSLIGKINSLRLGSDILTSMDITKRRFNQLQHTLIDNLLQEQTKKVLLHDKACCQMAIDVLIRNLFERTADVRWWATEPALWSALSFAQTSPARGPIAEARLRLQTIHRYYTVYCDLVLTDSSGKIIASAQRGGGIGAQGLPPEALESPPLMAPWGRLALQAALADACQRGRHQRGALHMAGLAVLVDDGVQRHRIVGGRRGKGHPGFGVRRDAQAHAQGGDRVQAGLAGRGHRHTPDSRHCG